MNCFVKFAAVSLLGLAPAWCDDQAKEPPKPVKPPAVKPIPKGPAAKGVPKAAPKGNVIRAIPGPVIQRFLRMTPQEREIAIDKMPVAQQEAIRRNVANFDALPAEERERRLRLFAAVSNLPRDQQDVVNQRIKEFQQLGPERKRAIQIAYFLLSGKTEDERRAIIDSPEFKERFTPTEQQIVTDLVKYYPRPEM
jgi:hypothetical protein